MQASNFGSGRGGSFGAPPAWTPPSPLEKAYYDTLFVLADDEKAGAIGGRSAVTFFSKSGLDKTVLREIWTIADARQTSQLLIGDFYVAMRLIAMAQQGQPATHQRFVELAQTPFTVAILQGVPPPAMPAPPSAGPSYAILEDEKAKYNGIFRQYDTDGDGYIQGHEAAALFQMSGLDRERLRTVWTLADRTSDGRLDVTEFYIAMHLIVCVTKRDLPLPSSIPYDMEQSLQSSANFTNPTAPRTNSFALPDGGHQPPPRTNSFGQHAAPSGFGSNSTPSGLSMQQTPGRTNSFGQQPSPGGFGQPSPGGVIQPPSQGSFGALTPGRTNSFGQQPSTAGFSQPSQGSFGSHPSPAPAMDMGFDAFDALAPTVAEPSPLTDVGPTPDHHVASLGPNAPAPMSVSMPPNDAFGGFGAPPPMPSTASRTNSFGSNPRPVVPSNFGSHSGSHFGSNSRPPPSPAPSASSMTSTTTPSTFGGGLTSGFGSNSGGFGSNSGGFGSHSRPPPSPAPSATSVTSTPSGFGSNSGVSTGFSSPMPAPTGFGSNSSGNVNDHFGDSFGGSAHPLPSPAPSASSVTSASTSHFASNSGFTSGMPSSDSSLAPTGFGSHSRPTAEAPAPSHFGSSSQLPDFSDFHAVPTNAPTPDATSTDAGFGAFDQVPSASPSSFGFPSPTPDTVPAASTFEAFPVPSSTFGDFGSPLSRQPSIVAEPTRRASQPSTSLPVDTGLSSPSLDDQFSGLSLSTSASTAFSTAPQPPTGVSATALASASALDASNHALQSNLAALSQQQALLSMVVRIQALVAELLQLTMARNERKKGPDPVVAASLQQLIDDERALIRNTSAALEQLEAKQTSTKPHDPFSFSSP
ncbi:hypothetical protein SPRG_01548 [Saprolegnia parasitica CBS 223.65]|uniref:Calmodulin n=1 Tax=Saprolegnia parasitica (strain CBS 223.65) TaxID=695850 RepID=A0A067D5X0_SAPPC|nr:hypothetical protein SPRG_01548 [Saprolegnia parasitica CBS 223.65]KDO34412.1 hypothetical protein SPRG_01548 [Saprolegnia parasitica CBS 223.65]|eukprot:XP_012195146.1 hypothetical protein SPRG_01548 [Saprolegnia parasitica CBS 223.65]